MGLSHLSIVRALDCVEVVGVVDATEYLLDVLAKYTGVATFDDAEKMFDTARPDAVVIATPTGSHAALVRAALDRGIHVFCEKPLTLSAAESAELAELARERHLIAQVGYHNRFIATFQEVKRLIELGAIGRVTHVLAEAYGPVVLKPKGVHVAEQAHHRRRLPLRLRRPSAGSCALVPWGARLGARDDPQQHLLQ